MRETALQIAAEGILVFGLRREIADMDRAPIDNRATRYGASVERNLQSRDAARLTTDYFSVRARRGSTAEHLPLDEEDDDVLRTAEPGRGSCNGIENRLDIGA